MKELLYAIVAGLVTDKDAIQITQDEESNADGAIVLHLTVAAEDMGRVIGKQGRIAKAIRALLRAAAARENQKVVLEIE